MEIFKWLVKTFLQGTVPGEKNWRKMKEVMGKQGQGMDRFVNERESNPAH